MSAKLLRAGDIDEAFRAEWRALADTPAELTNPYFLPWFLEPAIALLDGAGAVRLLTIRDEGRLIGLEPVTRGETYAKAPLRHFEIWRHHHFYTGAPLIAAGAKDAFYKALLSWLDERPEGARFFRFTQTPPIGALARALQSRAVIVESQGERAVLAGGRPFETVYGEIFTGRRRKNLRRLWRRFGETGDLRFERLTDPQSVAAAAAFYVAFEKQGWKGREDDALPVGRSEAEARFFIEAARKGAEAGAVVVDQAVLDGEPVAMLFSLRAGASLATWKTSFSERHAIYSPGVQLMIEATRLMLEDASIALLDSCARPDHPVADHIWRGRMRVSTLNVAASGAANGAAIAAAAKAGRALARTKERLKRVTP